MILSKRNKVARRAVQEGKAGEAVNPYLDARRTWNAHVGSLAASRALWQFTAIAALLAVLVAVGGIIHIGSQSKFVPYVVEVDKLGNTVAARPASLSTVADPRVVRAQLAEFINSARLVTPDVALQRKAIFRAYSMIPSGSAAQGKMNTFYNGDPNLSPFKRAAKEVVSIEIASMIPQTNKTWQIEWIESVRSRKTGQLVVKPFRMRALLTVTQRSTEGSRNEEQLRANPLGIYVVDYSWSKQI